MWIQVVNMNGTLVVRRKFFGGTRIPSIFSTSRSKNRKIFDDKRTVGWSVDQLFQVVSDVQEYKYFLPACFRSDVVDRVSDSVIRAELQIGIPPLITETYTSTVSLDKPFKVTAVSKEGKLFNHLKTEWKFEAVSSRTSIVSYHLDFEFKSLVYSNLVNSLFDQMAKQTMDAFMKRTESLYGPPVPVNDSSTRQRRD